MTVHDPIDLRCGDDWELTGPLQDSNGVALNLTGASISWKLDSTDNTVNLLSLAIGSGVTVITPATASIVVRATSAQTAAIPPGTYLDSLKVTLATGEKFTCWFGVIRAAPAPL